MLKIDNNVSSQKSKSNFTSSFIRCITWSLDDYYDAKLNRENSHPTSEKDPVTKSIEKTSPKFDATNDDETENERKKSSKTEHVSEKREKQSKQFTSPMSADQLELQDISPLSNKSSHHQRSSSYHRAQHRPKILDVSETNSLNGNVHVQSSIVSVKESDATSSRVKSSRKSPPSPTETKPSSPGKENSRSSPTERNVSAKPELNQSMSENTGQEVYIRLATPEPTFSRENGKTEKTSPTESTTSNTSTISNASTISISPEAQKKLNVKMLEWYRADARKKRKAHRYSYTYGPQHTPTLYERTLAISNVGPRYVPKLSTYKQNHSN